MKMRRRQLGGAERSRLQGATMLTVVVSLMALLAAASLAVDVGLLLASRTQLQNAVDALPIFSQVVALVHSSRGTQRVCALGIACK